MSEARVLPARPTLLFVHGWAFDASVWAPLRAALRDWSHLVADAGYFGPACFPKIDGPVIAIGHSMGVLRLLRELPAGCIGLVSINGFPRFGAGPDFDAGVPRRMLDRMMKRLSADPAAVLQEFRQRCGDASAFGEPRLAPLTQDLQALRDEDQRHALAALPVPLLVLTGQDDPIVPASMTQAAFDGGPDSERHEREQAGHLLPVSDAPWCARHIAGFIRRLTRAPRDPQIAARFGAAAHRYEDHAPIQRVTAERLAADIARLRLPPRPRILEIGCGTGLLTQALARRLGPADWTVTDISPAMLDTAQRGPALPGTARYQVLDGEHPPALAGPYDLICSSLAVQWFTDLNAGLGRLAALLAPGGHLAVATLADGTFDEWHAAHHAAGLVAATPRYPARAAIRPAMGNLAGGVRSERLIQDHPDGLTFLKGLKGIGATTPAPGRAPLGPTALRRVLAAFDEQGATVTYHLAYGMWKKTTQRPMGVFVTGTDTGIGKTLVSAILARAWDADYWKPVQTGVSEEPGDTETVAQLARLPPERLHLPAYVLQAPLSPWAAATLEDTVVDATTIVPPATRAPLIVEGAGGLYVPIDDTHMMIDLIARLDMPVVLAARSGLGTINHTLLSLEALKRRGIPVLGVIMSGPLSAGNKEAIERFGDVRVLAEIPPLANVDAAAVDALARDIPPLQECLAALGGAPAVAE